MRNTAKPTSASLRAKTSRPISTSGRKRQPMDFKVSVVPPAGITASGVRAFIKEAVAARTSRLQSDDPFFSLDIDAVRVTRAL
jgi:hypothetical protein